MKTINYVVSRDGIVPNSIQKGGIQGEHRMTKISFMLDSALYSELQSYVSEGKELFYHFDCFDGEGNEYRIGLSNLAGQTVDYELENRLTVHGGEIQVILVITLIETKTNPESVVTARELFTTSAKLSLLSYPYGCDVNQDDYISLPTLVEGINQSAAKAIEAAIAAGRSATQAAGQASAAATSARDAAKAAQSAKGEADRAKGEADRAETAWVNALPIAATCYNEAAAEKPTTNDWFIPKIMEKPAIHNGMMVNVRWINGRVDGVGYDIRLIYGEPGGAENEILIDSTSVIDAPSGMINIPTDGTIVYQLVVKDGRNHWKYISGDVIKANFSSSTSATVADKLVPNLNTNYVPGMEIYVQLDDGNTADVMRIVPDEGITLPVYGNGTGRKTGTIKSGYILQLKNAGDHWQIINGGGSVDELNDPIHKTMNVTITNDGFDGYWADFNDNDINNHRNAGGLVQAKYDDEVTGQTYTYYYSTMESDRKPSFVRTYIENDQVIQVIASVMYNNFVLLEKKILKPVKQSYVDNNFSNALKNTVSGNNIYVNDVSPNKHKVKCKVESLNLFDVSKATAFKNLKYDAAFMRFTQLSATVAPGGYDTIKIYGTLGINRTKEIASAYYNPTGIFYIGFFKDETFDGIEFAIKGTSTDSSFVYPMAGFDKGFYSMSVNFQQPEYPLVSFNNVIIVRGKNKKPLYTDFLPDVAGVTVTQQPSGVVHIAKADGSVDDFESSNTMQFFTSNTNAAAVVTYNQDINTLLNGTITALEKVVKATEKLNEVV